MYSMLKGFYANPDITFVSVMLILNKIKFEHLEANSLQALIKEQNQKWQVHRWPNMRQS